MTLLRKIDKKTAKIGVVGLGYVGLPLAIEFVKAGFKVTGIEVNESKIKSINEKKNYIKDVNDENLIKAVDEGNLYATNDFSAVEGLDCLSICVPTPLNKQKDPDISYILSVMDKIKDHIHKDMAIILESTTYPGSTRELILPYIENIGLKVGRDFFLCFSPERIDPGNQHYATNNTPKVIGGITEQCTKICKRLYEKIVSEVIPVSSTETAEMVKLLENTFRAINIGLANEIAIMCEKLGINAWEVIDAAATKPFGFMKFSPGPGLGGHCIPIDPHYLSWKLKTLDYEARFIQLAGEINTNMPNHILKLITLNLNKIHKSLNGSKILIIGIAYKKDIEDIRESPALDIIQLLYDSGANVDYFDPYVPNFSVNKISFHCLRELNDKKLSSYDLAVVTTDHSNIDFEMIYNHSKLIIDTRNVFAGKNSDHVKRLGQG